jgi:YHS domain-containing protein
VRSDVGKLVDPVCRMELTRSEVDARLTLDGIEHVFCSTNCLQQFVAAPDRYT